MSILNYSKKQICRRGPRLVRRSKYVSAANNACILALAVTGAVLIGSVTMHADVVRAATIRVAPIYLSPDTSSAKLADVDRGRELIFLETSGDWVKVEANLTEERIVTGWMQTKGLIQSKTPDGDKILFGEAVDAEDQASQRNGRRYAAQDAMRLYNEVPELFPKSPLAGEAMYRSADIRWQIEKADVMSLPSALYVDPYLM